MPKKLPVTLQMYTVRDDAARDLAGTIAEVARIGYAGVEIAGYAGATAEQYKALLDANGLRAIGTHVGFDQLKTDAARVIDEAKLFGYRHVTVPYIGAPYNASVDGLRRLGAELADAAGAFADAGLVLCYHNHAFEFERKEGDVVGFDALFDAAAGKVQVELDTFWVKKGGYDPAAYLRKYAGRVPLVHLKDMSEDGEFRPVGTGTIDYVGSLLPAAEDAGAEFYIVEQDSCATATPLESIAISYNNLKAWGVA